jgi:hypothetical protein
MAFRRVNDIPAVFRLILTTLQRPCMAVIVTAINPPLQHSKRTLSISFHYTCAILAQLDSLFTKKLVGLGWIQLDLV